MTTTATTPAVSKANKASKPTDAIVFGEGTIEVVKLKQATAPLINSNDVRMSNKEVIEQDKAKEQAKAKAKTDEAERQRVKNLLKPDKKEKGKAKPVIKPATTKEVVENLTLIRMLKELNNTTRKHLPK